MSTSSSTSSSFPRPATSSSNLATPGSGHAASTPAVVAGAPRGLPPLSGDTEQKIKALNQLVFEYLNELQCSDTATLFRNFIRAQSLAELSMLHVVRTWLSVLTGITLDCDDCELGPPTIITRFTQVDFNAVEHRAMEAISMRLGQPVISSPPAVPMALSNNQILHSTTSDFTLPSNLNLRFPSGSPHQTLPPPFTTNDTSLDHAMATSILSLDTASRISHDPFTSHDPTPADFPLTFGSDWEFDIPTGGLPQTVPYPSTTTNNSLLDHASATSILRVNTAPRSSREPFTSYDPTPDGFPFTSGSDMEFNMPTSSPHQTLPSSSSTSDTSLNHAIATSILSLDTAPRSSHGPFTSHDPTPTDYLSTFGSHMEFDTPSSPHQMYSSCSTLDTSDYSIDTPSFGPDAVPQSFHGRSTSHDPSHDPSISHPSPLP